MTGRFHHPSVGIPHIPKAFVFVLALAAMVSAESFLGIGERGIEFGWNRRILEMKLEAAFSGSAFRDGNKTHFEASEKISGWVLFGTAIWKQVSLRAGPGLIVNPIQVRDEGHWDEAFFIEACPLTYEVEAAVNGKLSLVAMDPIFMIRMQQNSLDYDGFGFSGFNPGLSVRFRF